MKIFKLIALILAFAAVQPALVEARSFARHSYALQEVLDAIYDASFDFEGVYVITHNLNFSDESLFKAKRCEVVTAESVVDHFRLIFDEFRSFFPDEELPYEQALIDVKRLLDHQQFKKCFELVVSEDQRLQVTHYKSLHSATWIKIEYSEWQ